MPGLAKLKRLYTARKKIHKLRKLRTRISPTGYTLRHFDEYRCVFIHIPKCAGASICQSLFGNLGAGHYSTKIMREVLGDDAYDQYFTFTIVRNPWDRLASAYHFLKAGGFHEADRRWAEANLTRYADFSSFVRHWVTAENVRSWVHFIPQVDYLTDTNGRMDVDYIGRFEVLQKDFETICSRLGLIKPLLSLNRATAARKPFQALYDEDTRAIVSEVYAADIKTFDYCFERDYQNTANSATPSTSR